MYLSVIAYYNDMSNIISRNEEREAELPPLQQFSHSVKISQSAKGARIDVHVSANSGETAMREAIFLYQKTKLELRSLGEIVAPIETAKNGSV